MQATSGQLLILDTTETLAQPLGGGAIKQSEEGAVGGEARNKDDVVSFVFHILWLLVDKLGTYSVSHSLSAKLCILVLLASYSQA